ncbi:hypothetical protein [Trichlorobacter lovleyi]|uniref:hypothetical protein n=1 Tax=Trichlorobacter lovleyi TaxID=313985 RepID=UPI0023F34D87|nr:hypothetical protein [Trichlorobacter lovleyi]
MGYKNGILRIMLGGTLLLSAASVQAIELHGRASSQYLWFNSIFNGKKQADFAQLLNFSLSDIDPDKKLTLHGYGRISQDVMNGNGFEGRLFYLYADYRDLFNKIDIRAGRQFVNYAAGSALVDGGMVDLKNVGPVAFSVMGGRNVVYGIDRELTRAGDTVFGAAATLTGFPATNAELSYFLKQDSDGVARETIGAMFNQYLFGGLKLYGNTRFDTASETFEEVLAGVKYFATTDLVLTAEWFQSYPTFDYTSIYSVFAVDRYQEGSFRADYTINDMFAVRGAYKRQDFGENTAGDVYEVGLKIRPFTSLMFDLAYDRRQGYAGSLDGFTFDVQYDVKPNLQLAGGMAYDVYQKDSMTGDTTSQTYWLGARYKLNKAISFDARVQDNVDVWKFKHDWSGRVAFNYDF